MCAYRKSFHFPPLVKFPKSNDDNPVYAGIPWQKTLQVEKLWLRELIFSRGNYVLLSYSATTTTTKIGVLLRTGAFFFLCSSTLCGCASGIMTVPVARKGLTPALRCYTSYTGFSPPLCLRHPSQFSLPPFPLSLPSSLWQHCSGLVTARN